MFISVRFGTITANSYICLTKSDQAAQIRADRSVDYQTLFIMLSYK